MAARQLRVALVTETYPPEINGVAMTLGCLVEGARARGHRVCVVRPRQRHEKGTPLPSEDLLVPGLPLPGYPELCFGLPVWGTLRRAWRAQAPDIVHVATEGPLTARWGRAWPANSLRAATSRVPGAAKTSPPTTPALTSFCFPASPKPSATW